MATVTFDDPQFHAVITSDEPIQLVRHDQQVTAFMRFASALGGLTGTVTPQQLKVSPDAGDTKYRMTFADTRIYRALLQLDPGLAHRRKITETSFFTLPELLAHNPVVEACLGLMVETVTNIDVDWTP